MADMTQQYGMDNDKIDMCQTTERMKSEGGEFYRGSLGIRRRE